MTHTTSYGSHRGFSLLEIMVAVAIIGVLAVVGVFYYQNYVSRAQGSEIALKYDAIRTNVRTNVAENAADDCSVVAGQFDTRNLPEQYAALNYRFEATAGGFRPVLSVCATTGKHGDVGVKATRAVHDDFAKNGVVEKGAVLTDSLVSFALRLTANEAAICKTYTQQATGDCSGSGSSGPEVKPPAQQPPVQVPPQVPVLPPSLPDNPAKPPVQMPPKDGPPGKGNPGKPFDVPPGIQHEKGSPAKPFAPGQQSTQQSAIQSQQAAVTPNQSPSCTGRMIADTAGVCFTPPTCSASEELSLALRKCVAKTCGGTQRLDNAGNCFTPPVCGAISELTADGKSCQLKYCAPPTRLTVLGRCIPQDSCLPPGSLGASHARCI